MLCMERTAAPRTSSAAIAHDASSFDDSPYIRAPPANAILHMALQVKNLMLSSFDATQSTGNIEHNTVADSPERAAATEWMDHS